MSDFFHIKDICNAINIYLLFMTYYGRKENHQSKRCTGGRQNLGVISSLHLLKKSSFVTVEINHLYLGFFTLTLDGNNDMPC